MVNIVNRVPQNPNQYTLRKSDGSSETVTLERADNPIVEGSLIGRKLLMAMQGFETYNVEFGTDYILETNSEGDTLRTTFPDGELAHQEFTSVSTGQTVTLRVYRDGNTIKSEYIEQE